MKALDAALSDSDNNMITPINVMDSLVKQVKEQIIDGDLSVLRELTHQQRIGVRISLKNIQQMTFLGVVHFYAIQVIVLAIE